jgi:uncharacterized protein (DUF433 family)
MQRERLHRPRHRASEPWRFECHTSSMGLSEQHEPLSPISLSAGSCPASLVGHRAPLCSAPRSLVTNCSPADLGPRPGLPPAVVFVTFSCMITPLTRITVDPDVCNGRPCVRGLRIPVSLVLKHLAAGKTAQQIGDEFPELEPEDVGECLRYAAWLASGRSINPNFAA